MTPKRLIFLGIVIIIITLLLSPAPCIQAATTGLLLWFNKVLPSLLPFIILINLLVGLNMLIPLSRLFTPITRKIWHLPGAVGFAFLMGLIAGYPMGAKIVKQLLQESLITPEEAQKALCFCNNCGPLFIIGTVGTLLLQDTHLGYFLLLIHVLSALIMSFILTAYPTSETSTHMTPQFTSNNFQFTLAFTNAIQNGMDTIVCVGGYIIFFSVLTQIVTSSSLFKFILQLPLIHYIPDSLAIGAFVGMLELSNGVGTLAHTYLISPSPLLLALLAFSIGFGGLCIYFQTLYVLDKLPFSTIPYLLCKLFQGVLSFLLTYTLYPLFSLYTQKTYASFSWIWLSITLLVILSAYFLIKIYHRDFKSPLHTTSQ